MEDLTREHARTLINKLYEIIAKKYNVEITLKWEEE